LQSKNKNNVWILAPVWQIAGVLFTAFVIAILLFYFQKKFHFSAENNLLYPLLIFFSVVIFYTLDHLYDELKFHRNKLDKNTSLRWNAVFSILSCAALVFLVIRHYQEINFYNIIIPGILTFIYFILMLVSKISFRWTKELIIAIVVSYALLYPLWGMEDTSTLLPVFLTLILVCAQNLVVFGVFEKQKDEYYGFVTAFSGYDNQKMIRISVVISFIISLGIVVVYFLSPQKLNGAFLCCAAYWFMLNKPEYFQKFRIYRFIADGVLLFLLI
jgi:hypothetical protein